MPLLFSGDVTIGGVNAPLGTSITAEIEGVQVATATTTIVGRYVVSIDYDSGYIGKTVVLKVEGAVGGQGTYVDPMTTPVVTVNLAVAGVTTYTLTMAVSGSGTTTPAVGDHDYTTGTVVDITATPDGGWQFDIWTGAVAAPTSATTTVTMDAAKTVTANFSEITAISKLIGADDATTGTNWGLVNPVWNKWAATSSGTVTEIRVKCNDTGNVKVAVYADNNGEPGALLSAVDASTPVDADWNNIPIKATPVTSGTFYWLAWFEDSACVAYQSSTEVPRRATTATYEGYTWPDPAGTLFNAVPCYDAVAGWGTIVPPTPPPTPTPLPPTKPVTFSWTASTGATKYQLQVNTDPGFGSGTSLFDSEVTATTQVVAVPIGTTCYWHVRAGMPWSAWTPTGTVLP
jgi:hypothetical protein